MQEPYIKVATGDYEENAERWGKEDALRANLCSIAHELTHYYQWIKRHEEWASGERTDYFERQALYYAEKIVEDYEEETNDFLQSGMDLYLLRFIIRGTDMMQL